jgi:hypothetical protein
MSARFSCAARRGHSCACATETLVMPGMQNGDESERPTTRPSPPTLKDCKRQLPFCQRLVSWTPSKLHPYSLDVLPLRDY